MTLLNNLDLISKSFFHFENGNNGNQQGNTCGQKRRRKNVRVSGGKGPGRTKRKPEETGKDRNAESRLELTLAEKGDHAHSHALSHAHLLFRCPCQEPSC